MATGKHEFTLGIPNTVQNNGSVNVTKYKIKIKKEIKMYSDPAGTE